MTDRRFCGNVDVLMSYLYDEGDPVERQAFEAHLVACAACASEVDGMKSTRGSLAAWEPPEALLDFRIVRQSSPKPGRFAWLTIPAMPAWAQFAAASLAVGVAVGMSGLEVRYDQQGWTMRAGWTQRAVATPEVAEVAATPSSAAGSAARAAGGVQPASTQNDAPWRAEMAALEQRLRGQMRPADASPNDPSMRQASTAASKGPLTDEEFLRQVRTLINASETRQQKEMAVRISQVMRDFDTQRRTDLARVVDGMGALEGRTGAAVAQQRELLNYLVRVSQK
jgi:hypothetical protein